MNVFVWFDVFTTFYFMLKSILHSYLFADISLLFFASSCRFFFNQFFCGYLKSFLYWNLTLKLFFLKVIYILNSNSIFLTLCLHLFKLFSMIDYQFIFFIICFFKIHIFHVDVKIVIFLLS